MVNGESHVSGTTTLTDCLRRYEMRLIRFGGVERIWLHSVLQLVLSNGGVSNALSWHYPQTAFFIRILVLYRSEKAKKAQDNGGPNNNPSKPVATWCKSKFSIGCCQAMWF